MNESNKGSGQPQKSEEISLREFLIKLGLWYKYLLSKWIIIVAFGVLGAVVGFLYGKYRSTIYTASSSFVLEEEGNGMSAGLGQYAGLASMVGIDLGAAGGGGIFQGDNLLELYKSRSMVKKTLLTMANFEGKKELLIDRYIRSNNLREKWSDKPILKDIKFTGADSLFSRTQDSVINNIVKDINLNNLKVTKPDKKLNIIMVEMSSSDELFSKRFNDAIVENVNEFYVQTKTKKSLDNLFILQHQTDSIRRALNGAISSVAESIDANPNPNPARQILKVPSQKRTVDAEANKAILSELVKNLEISKVSLRKETPLIQIIDRSILPLETNKISKIKVILFGGILGGMIIVIYLLVRKLLRDLLS